MTNGLLLGLGKSTKFGAFTVGSPKLAILFVVSNGGKTWVVAVGHESFAYTPG